MAYKEKNTMADVIDQTTKVIDKSGNTGDGDAGIDAGKSGLADGGEATGGSGDGFDVNELLDEWGLESPADLKEFVATMHDLKGKIGDQDLDELMEKASTLTKYQQQWAKQEKEKLKEKETPEETIARLEKENEELDLKRKKDSEKTQAVQGAKKAIEGFNSTVSSVIESDKAIPKTWHKYVSEFMGVNNPVNEVNIEDKAAVRRVAKEGLKKMNAFAQLIVNEYRAGKLEIPVVTKTETPATDAVKPKGAKNLRDARRLMHESMQGFFNRR